MITLRDYFGPRWEHPDATTERREAADDLLSKVNALLCEAETANVYSWAVDADTGTCVSGSKGGSGDGGFRSHDAKTGGPRSKHRQGRAVDIYDPGDRLDNWLTTFELDDGATNTMLSKHGLWREAPQATPGWCHLQDVAPGSGRRTFFP